MSHEGLRVGTCLPIGRPSWGSTHPRITPETILVAETPSGRDGVCGGGHGVHGGQTRQPQACRTPTTPSGPTSPMDPHLPRFHYGAAPVTPRNTAILVVVDRFSKAARFIALTKHPTAKQAAEILVREVVRYHGPPEDLVSDRGPQFVARFWKAFWGNLGASVSLTSGYHPQSNGQTERVNQALEIYLRCYTSKDPTRWSQNLLWAEVAHNQQWSAATATSPFEIMWGYPPHLFPSSPENGDVPAARSSVARLRNRWQQARRALLQSQEQMRQQAVRRAA